MIKKITLLLLFFSFAFAPLFAQDVNDKENLVKNAELEAYSGKLKKLGKFYMVEDWDSYTIIKPDYFEFWIDGEFSHCGVDSADLVKVDGEWKIANFMWTVEKEDCPTAPSH